MFVLARHRRLSFWPRRSVLVSLWFTPLVFWYLWIGFFGFHMLWVCKVNYSFQDCCLCLFCFVFRSSSHCQFLNPIFVPKPLFNTVPRFLSFWFTITANQSPNQHASRHFLHTYTSKSIILPSFVLSYFGPLVQGKLLVVHWFGSMTNVLPIITSF